MLTSVTDLAAQRRQIFESFCDGDNETADLNKMDLLTAVETQITNATFATEVDKQVGLSILDETTPGRWCDFQEKLYLRMREF
jgi:hypothetical protein